ncbi:hypothetical protein [Streptomyces sp. NPDC086776]|uniref:hypothetical protein n=1 Tax=Streptomyces sp. NPDC086776 TaxID=3365756 RepID=UPI00381A6396
MNPVGFGAMVIASTVSILAFSGLFGAYAEAFSTFIAAGLSLTLCPLIAWATKGKYYLARPNPVNGPGVEIEDITATHICSVCDTAYELPDIADCLSARCAARWTRNAGTSAAISRQPVRSACRCRRSGRQRQRQRQRRRRRRRRKRRK